VGVLPQRFGMDPRVKPEDDEVKSADANRALTEDDEVKGADAKLGRGFNLKRL
jgi:hypothetical protein